MNQALASARKRFALTILAVVLVFTASTWATLQIVNVTQIGRPATTTEIHSTTHASELSDYLASQKKYEAHFVNLATYIKKQEQHRLTRALIIVALIMTTFGVALSYGVSRLLLKPVKEAYESQERFLQDAAHELRNPLAALTIALQQHKTLTVSPRLLDTFRRQTKRLVSINEDLLFLERTSNQTITLVNVSELMHDVVEELLPLANKRGITLNTKTSENITKKIVTSDYVRLLKNALDNAIKYSPDKAPVHVTQRIHKNAIIITVTDKGIGIPEQETQFIGERFYRAKNVGNIQGTGLGIAIMKKILYTYGGTFIIKSSLKDGTTVTLTLPT